MIRTTADCRSTGNISHIGDWGAHPRSLTRHTALDPGRRTTDPIDHNGQSEQRIYADYRATLRNGNAFTCTMCGRLKPETTS
jgi:hypothetical protein